MNSSKSSSFKFSFDLSLRIFCRCSLALLLVLLGEKNAKARSTTPVQTRSQKRAKSIGGQKKSWQYWANRLTLGVDAREESLAHLKKEAQLESKLRSAMNSNDRFLAYDVIAALKLHSLLEDLLDASQDDREGYSYLTMNTLIQSDELPRFSKIYRERLKDQTRPASVRVILIDTISRMGISFTSEELKSLLLNDPTPEVRDAALGYLRLAYLDDADRYDVTILKSVLTQSGSQDLKLRALCFAGELTAAQFKKLGRMEGLCTKDFPTRIQSVCLRLAKN